MKDLKIIECKTCYGSKGYFGFKNGKQYTEDYWIPSELIEDYPSFKNATITFKGNNTYDLEGSIAGKWTFNIVKGGEFLTYEMIENIKNFKDEIYFNDTIGKYWIFDFKVNDTWVEAAKVNCDTMTMDLILFK